MTAIASSLSANITGQVSVTGVVTPTIANIAIPTAFTEVAYALPALTKRFLMKLRRGSKAFFQVSYDVGTSDTNYESYGPGAYYAEDGIEPSATLTLYFQASLDSQTMEITSWT